MAGSDFIVSNNHIDFSTAGLTPFLRQVDSVGAHVEILGRYGDLNGTTVQGGRVVFTGPDHNFHGYNYETPDNADEQARLNQYELLFQEIDWLLEE